MVGKIGGFKLKRVVAAIAAAAAVALILPGAALAETENIVFKDAALKAALIVLPGTDSNADGELTPNELAKVTGALDLSSLGISDITGLEYASGITALDLSDNTIRDISVLSGLALTSLDVSQNYLDLSVGGADLSVISALQTAGCAVTTEPQKAIPVSGVTLNSNSVELCAGDKITLSAEVSPADAANKAIVWTSGNDSVATVAEGVVTAVDAGSTDITATTQDGGFKATCTVTVKTGKLSSPVYTVSDGNIIGISKNTPLSQFLTNLINSHSDVRVYKTDGNELTDGNIGTGMTVKLFVGGIERDALKIIVLGDADGNGGIDIFDYTKTRLHILNLNKLAGVYFTAADVDKSGVIDIYDYTRMRLDILNINDIGGDILDLPEVTDPRISAFLDVALAQQGKPYVWGAEGPDSFDCSGFVYYCLRQTGYVIGRSTADTYSRNTRWAYVDKNQLQPGDLMFYFSDNPSDGDHIGHVGIYLGNGYHIHASSSYGHIVISRVEGWYSRMLSHGRRVFS